MKSRWKRQLGLCVSLVCVSIDTATASISWNWERPLPLGGSQTFAIWGTSRTDLWYGGEDGTLIHFDGKDWVRYDVGAAEISQFSGTSSTDIWAVGILGHYPGPGVAFHWDGNTWTRSDIDTIGLMSCIWEVAPDNVLAGGERGLFRWNGSTWSRMQSPVSYPGNIWGSSPDDIWVSDVVSLSSFHWNGSSWDPWVPVYVITGTAADDVWGFGWHGRIYHWDGQSWNTNFPRDVQGWESIKAFARNDVWAFAADRSVYHFDGVDWTEVTPPSTQYPDGYTVWVESSSYAISASPNGAIRTWDGRTWSIDGENRHLLLAVSGVGESLWAVGIYGTILHRDNGVWREEWSGTREDLDLVLATSSVDAWVAGWQRTLLHWNGREWEPTISPTEGELLALFRSASDHVGAISSRGEFFDWDGSVWKLVSAAPVTNAAYVAWASSSTDVWLAEGVLCIREQCLTRLWHWDGQRWEGTLLGGPYFGIIAGWSSGPNDAWFLATLFWHWDGSRWSTYPYPTGQRGSGLWGDRPDNVWHFGQGALDHWDGSSWRPVPVITRHLAWGFWKSSNTLWLAGENGMVLRGKEELSGR